MDQAHADGQRERAGAGKAETALGEVQTELGKEGGGGGCEQHTMAATRDGCVARRRAEDWGRGIDVRSEVILRTAETISR